MKNEKGVIPLGLLIPLAVVLIGVVAFGYFYWLPKVRENNNINQTVENANVNQNINGNTNLNTNGVIMVNSNSNINVNTNANVNANANANTNLNTNAAIKTGDEVTSIDATWEKYTNYDLGFSINVPKQAWYGGAGCVWTTTNGDHSYRPKAASVPNVVLADKANKTASIEPEYLYDLGGETMVNNTHYYSTCTKVSNSLVVHPEMNVSWNIKIATVNNDQDLDSYIKNNFGTGGCSLDSKKLSVTQAGVYDVSIKSDGLDPTVSKCFLNYQIVLKYYPAGHLVATWDMGQSVYFWAIDPSTYAGNDADSYYDTDMKNSFKFL